MSIASRVRSLIPQKIRTPLRRVYACIPLEQRMGKDYWRLKTFLQEAQWWDRERIEAWQLEKLKQMLRYVYENVPGYYELYREAGVKPDDIVALADVTRLPFTTKELIRDNLRDFTSRTIPSWRRRYATTGGSTGTPFGFYHTDVNTWMENAFMHSGWERVGWRLGDTSAVLRGSLPESKTKEGIWDYNPARLELLLSSYHLAESNYEQYIQVLQAHAPQHLQAYPSTVTLLADFIIERGDIGRISFKTILLGSENIYDWQKVKLQQAFPGTRIFGWYGHTEQVVLAPMCEESEHYHVWPFYGLTEIVEIPDGEWNDGKIGELAGTSFWNYGTPFIRYRTGDLAQRGEASCSKCGRKFALLERIEGRKQDYVVAIDGSYITLTALIFAQHFHAFGAIRTMQLYQDRVGEVTVKVVPTQAFSEQDSREISMKMETAAGGRIKVQVESVTEIPRTQRGKSRFLEQKLDVRYNA